MVLGSESDWNEWVQKAIEEHAEKLSIQVVVASCHRNPAEVVGLGYAIANRVGWARINFVICIGGKAFALPGVLNAWIEYFKGNTPVAGVAIGEDGSTSLAAAKFSISEIPGKGVVLAEGKALAGKGGLEMALIMAEKDEIPLPPRGSNKPANLHLWSNVPEEELLKLPAQIGLCL